jgi:hypothetical protein
LSDAKIAINPARTAKKVLASPADQPRQITKIMPITQKTSISN